MKLTVPPAIDSCHVVRQRQLEGLFLREFCFSPELALHQHVHEGATVCFALAGGCTENHASRTRAFTRRQMEYLPPGQEHSLMIHREGMRSFMVEYPASWLDKATEGSVRENSVHLAGGEVNSLMLKLYQEFDLADDFSPLVIEGLASEILGEISRARRGYEDYSLPPRWLMRAEEVLHSNFAEQLRLSEIAETVGVHPGHLAREFRRYYRATIGNYLRRLRIEFVADQLINCDQPIAQLALAGGFSDQSHLSRAFKKQMGVSPAAYRATFRSR